jgi:hypothetical protein
LARRHRRTCGAGVGQPWQSSTKRWSSSAEDRVPAGSVWTSSPQSRGSIGAWFQDDLVALEFASHEVRISPSQIGPMTITYLGHSPMSQITVQNSHMSIDQAVCFSAKRHPAATTPTVRDHRQFALWLDSVPRVPRPS